MEATGRQGTFCKSAEASFGASSKSFPVAISGTCHVFMFLKSWKLPCVGSIQLALRLDIMIHAEQLKAANLEVEDAEPNE